MTTRLLLLSDTHLPKRAKALQEQVWRLVDEAEAAVPAGGWVAEAFLHQYRSRAPGPIGVAGNTAEAGLVGRLARTRAAPADFRAAARDRGGATRLPPWSDTHLPARAEALPGQG